MVNEVRDLLLPSPPGVLLDATLGGAGHARALLDAAPHLRLIGLDQDPTAVAAAQRALEGYGARATIVRARFDRLAEVLADLDVTGVSAVLFDLGVSSPQLDRADRGFSYRQDAPLDMRMDPGRSDHGGATSSTAGRPDDLVALLRANGEGRFATRIVRAMVAARPLETTGQLAEVVRTAIPAAARRTGGHPARRVVPGHPHRGQRGTRRPAGRARRRPGCAGTGRPVRGHLLPLGGGPHRQATLPHRGDGRVHLPAGPALRLRGRPVRAAPDTRRPAPDRSRGGHQPAGRERPVAGRGAPRSRRRDGGIVSQATIELVLPNLIPPPPPPPPSRHRRPAPAMPASPIRPGARPSAARAAAAARLAGADPELAAAAEPVPASPGEEPGDERPAGERHLRVVDTPKLSPVQRRRRARACCSVGPA